MIKILLGVLVVTFNLAFFFASSIKVKAEGTFMTLPQAIFYIPSKSPFKVFRFDPQPPELLEIIDKNTKGLPESTFGIYVKNLSTGQEVSLNPKESFPGASLYKLSVMYTIHKKGAEGSLDLNSSDVQDNLKAMITVSSNEAALYLVEKFTSWEEITADMHSLGLSGTDLTKSPTITTPEDVAKLLELISQGRAVNMDASVSMLELMLAQQRNDRIPVYLPPNALVAHKTGELEDVRHDAGVIITPENNFILVLMSKNNDDPESVKPVMSKISEEVYEFFAKQWANPPEIL